MTTTGVQTTRFVVETVAAEAVANEVYFGDLDAVVGDGDLGFSLARGFEKVLESLPEYPADSAAAVLQAAAMTISSRTGGTSGPLWGTAFLRAAMTVKGVEVIDGATVVEMLRAAAVGIQARGKAELGDKTLLDALVPATDVLAEAVAAGADSDTAVRRFAEEMRAAAERTAQLQARRGRASYSGERSIGSPDAGAMVLAVLAERVADRWPERNGRSEP